MNEYQLLRQGGNNDAEAVKKLQTALYNDGYPQVGNADGIYGPKTEAAVRSYQQNNGLQVDGIAGNETLSHLYRQDTVQAPTETPPEPSRTETLWQEMQQAQTQQQQVSQGYQQQLQTLYDQIVNRPAFSYNINEDALFAQYADQYQRGGQLAMEHAMGQAAALTGGYGSSYGQSVGQQAYQQYMSALTEQIPVLEQNAYSRYQQQGQDALDRYALLWQQADDAYSKYMDGLQQQWQELDYAQSREQTAYNRLTGLLAIGYQPSDEELAAAGMTRAQADAIFQGNSAPRVRYSSSGTPQTSQNTGSFTGTTYQEALQYLEENNVTNSGQDKLLSEKEWKQLREEYLATGQGGNRVAAYDNYVQYVQSLVADKMEMKAQESVTSSDGEIAGQEETDSLPTTYEEAVEYLRKNGVKEEILTEEAWNTARASYEEHKIGSDFVALHDSYEEYLQFYVQYLLDMHK